MPAMQDRYAVPWDADASEARALWRGHGQNCGAVEQESGRMNNNHVSREAVEQIFSKMWFTVRQKQNLTDEEVKQIITKGRMELNRLQSAQPESCEYYALCRHGRDENKLRARLGFCEYCNEDADGYVKPIEKNCHAFIRFGMNGWELSLKANGWHGSAKIRYCPMCGRDLLVK